MRHWFKRYFVPNDTNGYEPHSLRMRAIFGMLLLAIISFSLASVFSRIMINSEWLSSAVIPAVIVDLTNEERAEAAANELSRNELLDEAARLKAEHMAEHEYFAHHSPDGLSPWYWFEEVGYEYRHAGENLAVHFSDSGKVVEAWMDSPGHRANILNGQYTEIGLGTARGRYKGASTLFVVQLFAAPLSERVAVERGDDTENNETPIANTAESETDVLSEATSRDASDEGTHDDAASSTLQESTSTPDRSLYSNTTTSSVAAGNDSTGEEAGGAVLNSSTFLKLLTQPTVWLSVVYLLLALYIAVVLILSVIIEWRQQHPLQLIYGVGLLYVLAILLQVHINVVGTVLIA